MAMLSATPAISSLPSPGRAPSCHVPRPPASIGALKEISPNQKRQKRAAPNEYLLPQVAGPTLHVSLSGADFAREGRYFLTLTASPSGEEHRTAVSDEGFEHAFDGNFSFALGHADLDLELRIGATMLVAGDRSPKDRSPRCRVLPELSPRGNMANLALDQGSTAGSLPTVDEDDEEAASPVKGWGKEVGVATLTLAELLSTPQPAGCAAKQHRIQLLAPGSGRRGTAAQPAGSVTMGWVVRDRVAEAEEAAERAAELQRQEKAAAEEAADVALVKRAMRRQAEERAALALVTAENAARRRAEADAFDKAFDDSKWEQVLDSFRVVVWLPEGTCPGSIAMSARQAVGLSDTAARSKSGMVAVVHAGLRVTLNGSVAALLRRRVEEKMLLQGREIEEAAAEPILIYTGGSGGASSTNRAITRAAEASGSSAELANPRHPTAPPRPRASAAHAESKSWLEAATAPLRPTPPKVGPNPKTAAILRAQLEAQAAAELKPPTPSTSRQLFSRMGGGRAAGPVNDGISEAMVGIVPTPPARVAPPSRGGRGRAAAAFLD